METLKLIGLMFLWLVVFPVILFFLNGFASGVVLWEIGN